MDESRSIRFSSRARKNNERGFAMVLAIVLAVLYFGMIELLMIDSSRELAEARRFRARIVAETLAESAAELAAKDMVNVDVKPPVVEEDWQGTMNGRLMKSGTMFDIVGIGETTGLAESKARVVLRGEIHPGGKVTIQYSQHLY